MPPQRKNMRFSTEYHKPRLADVSENEKVTEAGDRLKETITAVLGAAFLWLFVFQAVYRVILNFAEAQLFLLRTCRQIILRLVADCRLFLDSVMEIFWYILDLRMAVTRFCSYCVQLPVVLIHAVKGLTLRPLDLLVACTSPLRQGVLVCVLVLDWCCVSCWRIARRGGNFCLHWVDTVLTISSLVSQVLWQFLVAGVRAAKAAQSILVYTIMSYVCMAQVGLRLLMDWLKLAMYAVLGVGHMLQRLARWLWQDLERGVESVIMEFLATTWQILRTTGILAVYSVVICVRLAQAIGSWSLALCWGAPWTFQPAASTKKPYSLQSKPFQTTGEYMVDLVLSLAH